MLGDKSMKWNTSGVSFIFTCQCCNLFVFVFHPTAILWLVLDNKYILLCIKLFVNLVINSTLSHSWTTRMWFVLFFLSGGNFSTCSGYCGVFAEDHQQDRHHNGSRARSDREYMPTFVCVWVQHCWTFFSFNSSCTLSTVWNGRPAPSAPLSSCFTVKHRMSGTALFIQNTHFYFT